MEGISHVHGWSSYSSVLCSYCHTIAPAIKVPKWFISAAGKIRKGFLLKGRKEVNGGCCLVAWEKVCMPIEFGGLGIHNLEIVGWALQMRWLWLEKTRPHLTSARWKRSQRPTCHSAPIFTAKGPSPLPDHLILQ
ncbi:uncharacterized protein C2845_PM13G10410 [Panicum miliaceum]|uniref:Uncharacterized protein n=1 Tax=Panicum miliaceum TaxID=4540 RepID=A0A3L6RM92_PANMI|nr:uncharacterized protein C2845_PM13G10410 [Panicum miliaceum]